MKNSCRANHTDNLYFKQLFYPIFILQMASYKQTLTPMQLSGWDDDQEGQKDMFKPYFTLSIQNQMKRIRKNQINLKNKQESYRHKGQIRDIIDHSMVISQIEQQQKPRFLEMKTVAMPGVQGRKYRWSQETKQYFKLRTGKHIDHKTPGNTHKNNSILFPLKNTRTGLSSKPLSLQLKQSPQVQQDLSSQLIKYLRYRQDFEEKGSCVFQKPFSRAYRFK